SIVEDCVVHDNDGHGIHNFANDGGAGGNIIRRNRVYNNGSYGILLSAGSNNVAYNNVVYNNWNGLRIYDGCGNCQLYNNTAYGNHGSGLGGIFVQNGINGVVRNNIVWGNDSDSVTNWGTSSTIDHNLFSDPLFEGQSVFNFHITVTSTARNNGLNL